MGGNKSKKTFRDGSYYRHVWLGKRTVKEGECAAVWTPSGKRKVIEGPRRVRLFFSHVRFLDRFVADQNEYLELQFRDGRKENQRGPVAVFKDPCLHMSVSKHAAYKLDANEALVVYREDPQSTRTPTAEGRCAAAALGEVAHSSEPLVDAKGESGGAVQRRVVRGPAVFIPGAHEWIHNFSWHGSLKNGKGSKTGSPGDEKVPHAVNFEVLRTQPDQMYISVRGMRTTDDAQITIELMVFFELVDIEKMLNATNDPPGDFVNAASADVMTFGARNTYESLMQNTASLSDVETFPILKGRMKQTGFELRKIVYRGYKTSEKLQAMHDESIAKRTKMKLEADTRQMEQTQYAHELHAKQERSRAEMALAEAEVKAKLERLQLEEAQKRKARDDDHAQALRHQAETEESMLEAQRAKNDEELRRFAAVKDLGVDMTQYLCALSQTQPDHMTHIRLDAEKGMNPALHLDVGKNQRNKNNYY